MGNCYCIRDSDQKPCANSDINVEDCVKVVNPKVQKTPETKKNTDDLPKILPPEKNKVTEKEIMLNNVKINNIENKQGKKIFDIIEEEKKKLDDENAKSLEIIEQIKEKHIDLKREERDRSNIRIVLVGDKYVGKSSIIFQFVSNKFDNFYITTIFKEEFRRKLKIGENEYNICLSSLSGDPLYREDYNDIYEFGDIFLLVFDMTSLESFLRLEDILGKEIKKYIGLINENQPNLFLVGNKCDLKDKKVNNTQINDFCKKFNLEYLEVSAKNNRNIIKTFTKIAENYDEIINK